MNKVFSILFSLLIVLSGLHFSIATHYCGGELTEWKISVDQEKAGCDMCTNEPSASSSVDMEGCCKDALTILSVDTNYQPSTQCEYSTAISLLNQIFTIPLHIGLLQPTVITSLYANIHPPGHYPATDVNLTDICVFLI